MFSPVRGSVPADDWRPAAEAWVALDAVVVLCAPADVVGAEAAEELLLGAAEPEEPDALGG